MTFHKFVLFLIVFRIQSICSETEVYKSIYPSPHLASGGDPIDSIPMSRALVLCLSIYWTKPAPESPYNYIQNITNSILKIYPNIERVQTKQV